MVTTKGSISGAVLGFRVWGGGVRIEVLGFRVWGCMRLPMGPIVVPFWRSYVESYKV